MKTNKISYIIIFALLVTSLFPLFSFASDGIHFKIGNASGHPGDSVSVPITVTQNSGIVATAIAIQFDSDVLELVSIKDGGILGSCTTTFDEFNVTDEELAEEGLTREEFEMMIQLIKEEGVCIINWYNVSDITNTGTACTLNFKIKSRASVGKSEIQIECSEDDTIKSGATVNDFINVPCSAEGGYVQVVEAGGELPETEVTTTEETTVEETTAEETTTEETTAEETTAEEITVEETTAEETTVEETTAEETTAEETTAAETEKPTEETTGLPEAQPKETISTFTDVNVSDWFYDYVGYVVLKGYFMGTSDTEFSPSMSMTRAMFVTVLGRMSGIDTEYYSSNSGFSDVTDGQWYTPYVKWAAINGIVLGYDDSKFYPDNLITREQMCVMLVRYMEYKNNKTTATINNFADKDNISSWAYDAVSVAASCGLVTGKGGNIFDPQANATRAEIAVIFKRFDEKF